MPNKTVFFMSQIFFANWKILGYTTVYDKQVGSINQNFKTKYSHSASLVITSICFYLLQEDESYQLIVKRKIDRFNLKKTLGKAYISSVKVMRNKVRDI